MTHTTDLHHKVHRLTTVRLFAQGGFMARRGVLLVRSAYVLLVYISSERRFSLDFHII